MYVIITIEKHYLHRVMVGTLINFNIMNYKTLTNNNKLDKHFIYYILTGSIRLFIQFHSIDTSPM